MEAIASREINTLYILLDIIWFLVFLAILFRFKKHAAIVVGLANGVIYFLVDYGIFHLLTQSRTFVGADPFWYLLWVSITVGFSNFALIWLLLERDGHWVEWSVLAITGWFAVAFMAQSFGQDFNTVTVSRTTSAYHGGMAVVLLVGYTIVALRNLRGVEPKVNLLWLMAIGIGVQFAWEVILFLSQIRQVEISSIIVRSLLETNLGMPYIWLIYLWYQKRQKVN